VHRLGGLGLILLGIADNVPFVSAPAGSVDVFVIVLAAHRHQWWVYYALMATLGEVLGGYWAYRLAERGGMEPLEKRIGTIRAEKIYSHFEKRGFLTVFTGSILPPPFPFTPVLMTAGIMQYPRKKLLYALTAGRSLRFFCVAYLGRTYGPRVIGYFSRHYAVMLYLLIALAVAAGVGALVYFKWYRPTVQREERDRGVQVEEFPVPGRHRKTVPDATRAEAQSGRGGESHGTRRDRARHDVGRSL